MGIEEEHPDVLQNIEYMVANYFRNNPDLTDHVVARIYEAHIDLYSAEKIGRQPRAWNPDTLEDELFAEIKDICDWRLGRNFGLVDDAGDPQSPPEIIDLDTILLCLKKLRKSVQKWTKRLGRQGYLQFMEQYVK